MSVTTTEDQLVIGKVYYIDGNKRVGRLVKIDEDNVYFKVRKGSNTYYTNSEGLIPFSKSDYKYIESEKQRL